MTDEEWSRDVYISSPEAQYEDVPKPMPQRRFPIHISLWSIQRVIIIALLMLAMTLGIEVAIILASRP